jgi:hypothetical protein
VTRKLSVSLCVFSCAAHWCMHGWVCRPACIHPNYSGTPTSQDEGIALASHAHRPVAGDIVGSRRPVGEQRAKGLHASAHDQKAVDSVWRLVRFL